MIRDGSSNLERPSALRRGAFVLVASTFALGCKTHHPLVGRHCEGGVDRDGRGQGGDCVDVRTDGTAVFVSRYTKKYSYRATSTKGRYELVLDGQVVGVLEHDPLDRWLYVTWSDDPKRRIGFRDDMPGPFI